MRKRISAFSVVAILAAVLGVSYAEYANTSSHLVPYPTERSSLDGTTAIATRNGVLKCKGKVVKIRKSDLRGELAPHPDAAVDSPQIEEFGCSKDENGRETGDVAAKSKKKVGETVITTISASE